MMKLIFITREGYNLAGARIRCYNFAREIVKYRVGAEVLSFSDNLGAKDGQAESGMTLRDKIRINFKVLNNLLRDKNNIFYIQRFNYHSFAPYLAHLLNKNRIILDLDDWEMRENPGYYFGFYPSSKAHYFTREIAKRSIFCIAASRFLEGFLLQFNKKTYYIPSGVDLDMFKCGSALNNDELVFSWVGTLHKQEYVENINLALDCFHALRKHYSHIYFDIVGDGIYREALVRLVGNFQDNHIRLKDWIAPNAIPEYLSGIDVGLFPITSKNKFNQAKSPTKIFEYMAMAKPTIASPIGEAGHIIRDGENGFLAKDKTEFIAKMRQLIDNLELRRSLGIKAREGVERNYSLQVLGRQLYEILKGI